MNNLLKRYGAKGDGVHDDTGAFQAVVDNTALRSALQRIVEEAKLLKAFAEEVRDRTFTDAEGPELRAQNECNHRRACEVLRRLSVPTSAIEAASKVLKRTKD